MNASFITLLLLLLPTPQASTQAEELFAKLDRNSDGQVSGDEVSKSQQKFFHRALRVADVNEDGSLSRQELNRAVTDPRPVELPGQNPSQRLANLNPEMLDRNRDGRITAEEMPGPLKQRFEQLLDRIGQESVEVSQLQTFLRGERPTPASTKAPRDDEMETSQMAGKSRIPEPAGDPKRRGKADRAKNQRGNESQNPEAFRQLDRNADGKLTGEEIPPRLRRVVQAVDSDNDGAITHTEFADAAKRRMPNP
jgi:Ca2+-binding EF-hand superfamily protein